MSIVHGFFHRILFHLSKVIYRHPGTIVGLGIAFTLLCGWYTTTHFKMINSIGDLLDEKSSINRIYEEYKQEFNVDEEYVIVITSPDPLLNRQIADTVATRLHDIGPGIRKVFYKLDFSKLERRFLLMQSESELKQIEGDVSSYANALKTTKANFDLNSMLNQATQAMGNEQYLRKKENWKDFKPFVDRFASMLDQLADKVEGKPPGVSDGNDLSSADVGEMIAEKEYLSYDHGRTLLVLASPGVRQDDSASPYTGTLGKIRAMIADLHAQNPTVSIGLTGEPVLNDDEMQTAAKDVTYASIITFILITLLFVISYKEYARPGLAILVLLMAVVWCFGATMFFVGHLNVITNAFVPMVLGLGIDFGIQIMGRYEEELGLGRSIEDALSQALQHTGVAIITGGSTTAAAFFSMCFNDFKGLAELGIICGASMALCLIANIVLLPAFYVLRDRKRPESELHSAEIAAESHFTAEFNACIVRWPRTVLAVSLVVTVVALFGMRSISFDYNLLNMQNQKLQSVQVEKELLHELGSSSIYATITVNNLDEARDVTQRLLALPTVKEVQSIASVLPDNQEAKLASIRRIVASLQGVKLDGEVAKVDLKKARRDVSALLDSSKQAREQAEMYVGVSSMAKDAVETFKKLIPPLERSEKAMASLSEAELGQRLNEYQTDVFGRMQRGLAWLRNAETKEIITLDDVPLPLRQRFIGNTGKLLLQVYAKEDIWDREPLVKFVHEVQSVDKDASGTPIQNYAYIDLLRVSYQQAALWSFLAIVVLILLHFRSMIDAALAILPLAVGVIWTLGAMGWFHIQFNPANIMTLPMLLGIGVAYGVYTTDRFREAGKMEIFSTSTGKAIILSALTTLFGFASMLISDYRGLFSMGLVMTLGVVFCLVTSLVILPQILKLLEKQSDLASASEPHTVRRSE